MEIRELESLLLKKFNPKSEILDLTTQEFLLPHENALSKVLKVRATVKEFGQESSSIVNLIVKFLIDEELQKSRATHCNTFETEILFYEKLVPIYDQLMKNYFPNRKKIYPEFFGARLSLNEDAKLRDDDVAILLEDLSVDNYRMVGKRLEGLDLPKIISVLDSFAMFHSLGLMAKQMSPDYHRTLEYVRKPGRPYGFSYELERNQFLKTFSKMPKFEKYRSQIVEILVEDLVIDFTLGDPWNTVIHGDLWTSNVMFGNDDHAKFVDYQLLRFASPLKDLLFFLFTSVELDLGNDQIQKFAEFYLDKVNCYLRDHELEFSREIFEDRLKIDAKEEFLKFILHLYYFMRQEDVERDDPESFYFKRIEKMLDFYVWKKWLH